MLKPWSTRRRAATLALVFALLWIARTTEYFLLGHHRPDHWSWWRIGRNQFPLWLTLGFACALILHLARRFPYDARRKGRTVAIHVTAILLLTAAIPLVDLVLQVPGWVIYGSRAYAWRTLQAYTWLNLYAVAAMVLPFYLIVVFLSWFWRYYRTMREKELQAAELRVRLAQSELQSLKMQVNPHFLFNTLNSISTLLRVDVGAAENTLEQLAILLRRSLDAGDIQEISLREELAFIRDYLELEQVRFSNRLRLEWDIDPATEEAQVPHLILQPLVENAIKHGFWPTAKPGRIRVSSRREGAILHLTVEDDGAGLAPGRPEGVGLSNSRARLKQLYGEASTLSLESCDPTGARASVLLPFHESPLEGTPLEEREVRP